MQDQRIGRRWMLQVSVGVAIAIAMVSMVPPSQAVSVSSACCFAAGNCEVLPFDDCITGGGSVEPGNTCDNVDCPILCSAAGPECNGQCPTGTTCVDRSPSGATTSALSLCQCVPQIPEGGACDAQPDACAPGLSCQNGICALTPAPAPLLSTSGMVAALATLLGFAGAALRRR